jgi:hypothetical protein
MSEPIETVVTDMRKLMGVYGINHLSPFFSANRGSIDRKINRQLFKSPISGRKRNISETDSQDNFSGLVRRTPQRKSRDDDVDYEEDESEFGKEPTELIFSREEISIQIFVQQSCYMD